MTPEDRISVIKECIEHLKARPGRKVVTSLEGMLIAERAKQLKPAKDHPWRGTVADPLRPSERS